MKRILVPCDFSPTSDKAIRFAIDFADNGDELFLLNLINDYSTSKKPTQDFKELELKFKNLIDAYPEKAISLYPKIQSGKFLPSILNFIKDEKMDLVIMGTHGSQGWGEFFMGSNIEKVVRTSPIPVFTVRGATNFKSINDIVFPCDLRLDHPQILSKVKELQKLFHSRLHLLRINTGKSLNDIRITDKLEEYASHYQLSNYTVTVLNETNIRDGILHFAREINADMITMVPHGKRNMHHLFAESTTADIVNHANILVWTCSS